MQARSIGKAMGRKPARGSKQARGRKPARGWMQSRDRYSKRQEARERQEAIKSLVGDEMLTRVCAVNQACLSSTMSESTLSHIPLIWWDDVARA